MEAALLHDTIEDTSATAVDLQAAAASSEAIAIVELVTKDGRHFPAGLAYLDWIRAIGGV